MAVKEWIKRYTGDITLFATIFLVVILLIGVYRLQHIRAQKIPVSINGGEELLSKEALLEQYQRASELPGLVAASRQGKRYYYLWCGGLARIKEANRRWFESAAQAEAAGYTLASGCEGF